MPQTTGGYPMETLQKELAEIKSEQRLQNNRMTQLERMCDKQDERITSLERTSDKHGEKIDTLNQKLNKIDDNTTWIKRAMITGVITLFVSITGAIVIASINGVFENLFSK